MLPDINRCVPAANDAYVNPIWARRFASEKVNF